MGKSLDDILADGGQEPVAELQEVVEPTPEPQTPEPEASTEAEPQAEPEPSDDEPKGWQYAAYKDEKTKRQEMERKAEEAERRAAEFERRVREYEAQQEQAQQAQIQQDPQLMAQHVNQSVEQARFHARLDASEIGARSMHGDEAVDAAFQALQAANDPSAYGAIMGTKHPWDAMVKWHKKQETLSKLGDDPDAYINEQVQARVADELAKMNGLPPAGQTPAVDPSKMPTDLSQNRSVGARTGSNWSGPASLEDILKN
ncbi:MAG: hypothetical protein AAGF20_00975 [Pseudomonadota bacterium]